LKDLSVVLELVCVFFDGTRKIHVSGSHSVFSQKYNIEIEETEQTDEEKPLMFGKVCIWFQNLQNLFP
jgi:hypothetical protein